MVLGLHSLTPLLLLVLLAWSSMRIGADDIPRPANCDKKLDHACFGFKGNNIGEPFERVYKDEQLYVSCLTVCAYVTYNFANTKNRWRIQIASKTTDKVTSFKIGNDKFTINKCDEHPGQVMAVCNREKETIDELYLIHDYVLEPFVSTKSLHSLFGFGEAVADEITLTLPSRDYTAKGISDFPLKDVCGENLESTLKITDELKLTCEGSNIIRYNPTAMQPKTTLEDLQCDNFGWKDGTNLISKHSDTTKLFVDCVESCNDNLIVACNTPSTPQTTPATCEKPKFAAHKLICPTPEFILYGQNEKKVEKTAIECKKKSFENTDKSINIVRQTPDTKAAVECLSKCHGLFVNLVGAATKPTKEERGLNLKLVCDSTTHYTVAKVGTEVFHTAKAIFCDSAKGWIAEDIKNNAVFADFNFENKIDISCVEVCEGRVDDNSCASTTDCTKPVHTPGSTKLECGNDQILRFDNVDYFRDGLSCTKDLTLLSVDAANAKTKYKIQCISKCASEFVTGLTPSDKKLTCPDTEILLVKTEAVPEERRYFETLTCDASKGWMNTAATEKIVDFTTNVKITGSSCYKVCDSSMIDDVCEVSHEATPECVQLNPAYDSNVRTLTCGRSSSSNYRVFINDKQCEYTDMNGKVKECAEQKIECKREGWFAGQQLFIDFKDKSLDINQKFRVSCKHKCSPVFVEDSCKEGTVVTGKTTCSKVEYVKEGPVWKTSCSHPSEIIVLEQEAGGVPTKKESFGTATCSNDGWKDDKDAVMFALSGAEYKIKARCEQLCHPDLLQGNTIASRSYKLDEPLTCTAEKEMLQFIGDDVYSDLTCSKEGWRTSDEMNNEAGPKPPADARKFAPNTVVARVPQAECVTNKCVRDFTPEAKARCPDGNQLCSRPDFSKVKYSATCPSPKKLLRVSLEQQSPVTHPLLLCRKDGGWYEPSQPLFPYLSNSDPFDLFCSTAACTSCEKDVNKEIAREGTDSNWKQIKFVAGEAYSCSRYTCSGNHYRVSENSINKYFVSEDNNAFQCEMGDKTDISKQKFVTPEVSGQPQFSVTGKMGCVEQIPCFEHSPLDLSCDGLQVPCESDKLKTKLTEGSRKVSGQTPFVKCDDPEIMYLMTGDNKWTVIDGLKCDNRGEWVILNPANAAETTELTKPRKQERKPLARVVCATSDPTVLATTTPPNPFDHICSYCSTVSPPEFKCDTCLSVTDNLNTESNNGVCTATSKTGRFLVNDGSTETTKLTCKEEDGKFVWRDEKGKEVAQLAARAPKITDKISVWAIIGIAVGSITLLSAVAGLIVFGYVRRKREARRLETLKSKGLSQRIDTIIEKVSVEDPQTVRL